MEIITGLSFQIHVFCVIVQLGTLAQDLATVRFYCIDAMVLPLSRFFLCACVCILILARNQEASSTNCAGGRSEKSGPVDGLDRRMHAAAARTP